MNKKIYHLILICLCIWRVSIAQKEYSFIQISYEQGLPGTNVKAIFTDSRGIMWVSIEGLGLARYDGHKFYLFSNNFDDSTSISSNFINDIEEDSLGYLWLATDYGLSRYNYKNRRFRNFYFNINDSTSIPDNVILSVTRDNKNNLWVGTANGFASLDAKNLKFKRYLFKEPNQNKQKYSILKLFHAKNGILWIGTSLGLKKFIPFHDTYIEDKGTWYADKNLINKRIFDLEEDNYGNLWIATNLTLCRLNIGMNSIERWKFSGPDQLEISQNGISSLEMDNEQNLWVGTWTKGLILINTREEKYIKITESSNHENGIKSDHLRSLYKDPNGTVWIGTKYGGLLRYINKNNLFNIWSEKYGLLKNISNKYVLSIYDDMSKIIWIGTKFSGLYKVDMINHTIENYRTDINKKGTILSDQVQAIFRDSENNIWVGTKKGLNYFDDKKQWFIPLNNLNVNSILEDQYYNLWIGTENGVYLVDKDKKKINNRTRIDSLIIFRNKAYEILHIEQDHTGTLWFSTKYKGVFRYHPITNEIQVYSRENEGKNHFSANMIRTVYDDYKNHLWIGTKEAGLIKYNIKTDEFFNYTVRDGLASNMVMCIKEDYQGNIWLGTNNGISKLDPNTGKIVNFNQDYGIKSNVNEIGASHRFKDGALLFGGSNGFNIFYPKDIKKSERNPTIIVSAVKTLNNLIYSDLTSSVNVELSYNQNNISFEFSITNYDHPSRHNYMCIMEGVDKNWINLGNRNYASYPNMPPGKYTFIVKGADELGAWSETIELPINILFPWWQKSWFRIVGIICMTGIVFLIYVIRINQINLQKKELERQVELRTRELNESNNLLLQRQKQVEEQSKELAKTNKHLKTSNATKSRLFSIIAHDLKNPFSSLQGLTDVLLNRYDNLTDKRRQELIALVNRSAKKIFNLVDNLLQWSWAQSEKIRVLPEKVNIRDLVDNNIELMADLFKQKDINVSNEIPRDYFVIADKQMINTVIRNLLSNAIKFTQGGVIIFSANKADEIIKTSISDSGVGIPRNKIDSIFNIDKEKSTKGTQGESGTGLGLILCKEFIKINSGNIYVESEENKGTCFSFTLPAYKEE